MKTSFDESWKEWITTNLARGCSKQGMYDILIQHDFAPELITEALDYEQRPVPIPSAQPVGTNREPTHRIHIPRATRIQHDNIELFHLRNFLNEYECIELISIVRSHLRASTTTNDSGTYAAYRTSKTCDLALLDHPLVKDIDRRICAVMGLNPTYSEHIQAQWYDVGEEFKPHTDYFEPNSAEFEEHARDRGQRTWTFMIYLNNTQGGGSTRFVNIGQEYCPEQGTAVIWNNLHPDGSPNGDSLHWGMPVTSGYKVIITKWFRDRGQGPAFIKEANEYLPSYTSSGFLKSRIPEELFRKILQFYHDNQHSTQGEVVEGFITGANGQKGTPSELIPLSDKLKDEIHQQLLPLMEAWTGHFLQPTYVFGIRRYRRGAVLKSHRDRDLTHIASIILNLSQDVDEQWPLEIEDHGYRKYRVLLAPGDMLFYEGGRLLHGRPTPLQGKEYANIFVHYAPVDAEVSPASLP